MSEEKEGNVPKQIILPEPNIANFFIGRQIAAINSYPETENRINVCLYLLKTVTNDGTTYRLLINFGKKWSWTDEKEILEIAEDYEKLLFHEMGVRGITGVVH